MLCEATVVAMLERGREPLAVGRARRFATRAQRRALYRRDRGCARPGCPETRPERLHAHHIRHWLHGGATDITNMVLLCDTDHGLVHDEDLVLSRAGGRLTAVTRDGRRVWGRADAAYAAGLDGTTATASGPGSAEFVGVHPIDLARARRSHVPAGTPGDPEDTAPGNASTGGGAGTGGASITSLLFPGAPPDLPEAMHVNGERMDLEWVVWTLLHQRDLARRLAAEAAGGGLTAVA
jgi:hypothetical protein